MLWTGTFSLFNSHKMYSMTPKDEHRSGRSFPKFLKSRTAQKGTAHACVFKYLIPASLLHNFRKRQWLYLRRFLTEILSLTWMSAPNKKAESRCEPHVVHGSNLHKFQPPGTCISMPGYRCLINSDQTLCGPALTNTTHMELHYGASLPSYFQPTRASQPLLGDPAKTKTDDELPAAEKDSSYHESFDQSFIR